MDFCLIHCTPVLFMSQRVPAPVQTVLPVPRWTEVLWRSRSWSWRCRRRSRGAREQETERSTPAGRRTPGRCSSRLNRKTNQDRDCVTSTPLLQFKFLFICALLIICFIGLQDNVTGNNSSYCLTGFHCLSIDQILQPTVKYLNNFWIDGREIWWMKLRIIFTSSFIPCWSVYSHQQVIISTRRTLKTNDCFTVDPTGLCCIKMKQIKCRSLLSFILYLYNAAR